MSVTPEELRTLLASTSPPLLIDVRKSRAVADEPRGIPGAVWRDPMAVDGWGRSLRADTPMVVYCVHGHEVSHNARDRLRQLGLNARLVAGGLHAWIESGGETAPVGS